MTVDLHHPDFPAPSPETVIWRYSSFTKLLSLISSRALHLTGLRALQASDPFEGEATIAARRLANRIRQDEEFRQSIYGEEKLPDAVISHLADMIDTPRFARLCFVSCWHSAAHESAALWRLYSAEPDGIAIKSTIDRLARAIDPDHDFILGAVTYHDYETVIAKTGQALSPVFMKRQSFEHEREVRLMYWAISEWSKPADQRASWAAEELEPAITKGLSGLPLGIDFRCNADELIDEVVVSPYAEGWVVDTITSVLRSLGCKASVRRSNLMRRPVDYDGE